MEWTKIEKKWHEMALRLQAANRVADPRKTKASAAGMVTEGAHTEPLESTASPPSGDRSASVSRQLA